MDEKSRPNAERPKKPGGPPELVVRIGDTLENLARSAFGMKRLNSVQPAPLVFTMFLQYGRFCVAILFLAVIHIVALSQMKNESCYPASGVMAIKRSIVRLPLTKIEQIKHAEAGSTYAVLRSQRHDGECWVRIDKGWIRAREVMPASPPTPTSTPIPTPTPMPTATPLPACYGESHVYLAGQMNIRQSHNVHSTLMGGTKHGDLYEVRETYQGATYCWLRIKPGWIARLGIVQSLDEIRLPRIDGSSRFVDQVRRGLRYLKHHVPHWFVYVVTNTRTIRPSQDSRGRSTAEGWIKRTSIHSSHLFSTIVFGSVLVHEACHHVQYARGDRPGWFDTDGQIRKEKECFRTQRRMVREIDPDHWFIDELTSTLNQSRLDWLLYVW